MNKYKKIAFAVVSTVMAGTMAFGITACGKSGGNINGGTAGSDLDKDNITVVDPSVKPTLEASLTPSTEADGRTLKYAAETTLDTSFGYEKTGTGIVYEGQQIKDLGGASATSATFAGKTYVTGDLKPAWSALSEKLGIKFEDDWTTTGFKKASDMIKEIKQSAKGLDKYAMITASSDAINTESINDTWLDINQYLYYMPNYAKFLEANPVVRLSLTADPQTGAMYMLPYFDGNDDIEKYVLMRKDVVEKLLDTADVSAATGTFKAQADAKNGADTKGVVTVDGSKASVQAFMGTTGNYEIETTDPAAMSDAAAVWGNNSTAVKEGSEKATVTVVVDYAKVISELKKDSALKQAIVAAGVANPQTASGNIVDIQNQIINETEGACTGAQLTKVLQEYIKVAYHKKGESTAFYTKLSDVFNSAYAAWDVDLYVALGRCAVSSSALLGGASKGEAASYMLGTRLGKTNRTYDAASMAGELYGVRGLTSRYASLYAYIDNNGKIVDARSKTAMWDALAKMSLLAKEGLYYTGESQGDGTASIGSEINAKNMQFYSSTDYVQTQSAKGGFVADGTVTGNIESGYNYAPILTPVSRWDVNDDGTAETVMRFTESWRGVKDGGFVVSKQYVKDNPEKLAAVLKFIDYFFSNDGQILMTYGPQSATDVTTEQGKTVNTSYGTWYATKANKTLDAAKSEGIVDTNDGTQYFVKKDYAKTYFCYNNELYTGKLYNGKQIPVLTTENLNAFYNISGQNFTNHARKLLGSCLNLGVKDQGFEYQCTSKCGIAGSQIWAIANVNGTIKHTTQTIDNNNPWYTLVPTSLPFKTREISVMNDTYKYVSGKGGDGLNFLYANSGSNSNLLTDMMYYGYDTSKTIAAVKSPTLNIPENAAGVIAMLDSTEAYGGLSKVNGFMTTAWANLLVYYQALTK